jgi:hypothetical protein
MERDLIFHTQEVTGSSPVAPTIHFKQIQTEGTGGESCCDVDCDVKSQFAFLDSAGSLPRAYLLDRFRDDVLDLAYHGRNTQSPATRLGTDTLCIAGGVSSEL